MGTPRLNTLCTSVRAIHHVPAAASVCSVLLCPLQAESFTQACKPTHLHPVMRASDHSLRPEGEFCLTPWHGVGCRGYDIFTPAISTRCKSIQAASSCGCWRRGRKCEHAGALGRAQAQQALGLCTAIPSKHSHTWASDARPLGLHRDR